MYRSKIGREFVIPLAVIIGGPFIWMLFLQAWYGVVAIGLFALFALHLFTTTYYIISGDTLYIKSGFIIQITIDIGSITKISATRNMLSSPALSLDRLEIFYNKYDSVLISPKDKEEFIAQLQDLNRRITYV
ncbi:MAG: PH domain-containing protein [Mucilaginibacter sp.]